MESSLARAYQNRRWLLTTSVIENILFSALLLGWPALISILKTDGYYAHLCTTLTPRPKATVYDLYTNSTRSRSMEVAVPHLWTEYPPLITTTSSLPLTDEKWSCPEQEKRLNKCFTLGSFLMNILTLPIGLAVNKIGAKGMRCFGLLFVCFSFVLFTLSAQRAPHLLLYACAVCGFGGNIVMYTSLQVANLFGNARAKSLGILFGSYAASAAVFPVFYSLGVPWNMLFLVLGILCFLSAINSFFLVPIVAIPVGIESFPLGECKPILTEGCISEKSSDVGFKGAASSHADDQATINDLNEEASIMPLHRIIYMPMYLWSVIFLSVTQLRLVFFVGDLNQMLVHSTRNTIETVDLYVLIFGILQLCCLGTTHFIGGFVDWRNKKSINPSPAEQESRSYPSPQSQFSHVLCKECSHSSTPTSAILLERNSDDQVVASTVPIAQVHGHANHTNMIMSSGSGGDAFFNVRKSSLVHLVEQTENGQGSVESTPERKRSSKRLAAKVMEKKIEKLKHCAVVFFITSILMLIFGLLVLIPSLTIQVSTFVCYTLIRGLVPCAIGRLYSVAFHSNYHQSLIGLLLAIAAIFSTVQHPLFMLVMDFCNEDPYWVNVALLLVSLLGFGLPLHLLFHCKHLEQWKEASITSTIQPVVVKMQYVDNKLNTRCVPTEL